MKSPTYFVGLHQPSQSTPQFLRINPEIECVYRCDVIEAVRASAAIRAVKIAARAIQFLGRAGAKGHPFRTLIGIQKGPCGNGKQDHFLVVVNRSK